MRQDSIDITLLCRVIDNFGDIGVVYRLARAVSDLQKTHPGVFPAVTLRLVVDDLNAFSMLAPGVNPDADFQELYGWKIYRWNADDVCSADFSAEEPQVILECFQCGRPDWLEKLLFCTGVKDTVHIIMLDYLSAEDYAETFHCLKSLTRSSRVQKVNFMPGFTDKTGGLILDEPFMKELAAVECAGTAVSGEAAGTALPAAGENGQKNGVCGADSVFTAVFFSYDRDWLPVVNALAGFKPGRLAVLAARGKGFDSFMDAWARAGKPFCVKVLDFMPQTEWDALLCRTPLLFVRGEDSLSRACLAGHPFVWHAYPQTEEYQLVKVRALLDRMRPFFLPEDFSVVEKCWISCNGGDGDLEENAGAFLQKYENLCSGFSKFAGNLKKNGDLAYKLMTFIMKMYII